MLAPDCDLRNNSNRGGKLTVCVDLKITTAAGKFCFRWFDRRFEIRWVCVNFLVIKKLL